MVVIAKAWLFVLVAGILISFFSSVEAQTNRELTSCYGGYLDAELNLHSANFQTLPGVQSCCPRFETGSGFGPETGLFYDLISRSHLSLEIRLVYSNLNATLRKDEVTTVTVNDEDAPGVFEHTVRSTISMLAISPLAKYAVFNNWNIFGGLTAGYILSTSYSQQEEIIQPVNNGTFENGRRIRNQYSGATPNGSKSYAGITMGMQYQLPLNSTGTLQMLPELQFTYGLTPIATGMSWHAHSIKAGVAIQYDHYKTIEPPPAIDTTSPPPAPIVLQPVEVKPKTPVITAELATAMIDTDGVQKPIAELVIEDYIRTQYSPLLNYVFFD